DEDFESQFEVKDFLWTNNPTGRYQPKSPRDNSPAEVKRYNREKKAYDLMHGRTGILEAVHPKAVDKKLRKLDEFTFQLEQLVEDQLEAKRTMIVEIITDFREEATTNPRLASL